MGPQPSLHKRLGIAMCSGMCGTGYLLQGHLMTQQDQYSAELYRMGQLRQELTELEQRLGLTVPPLLPQLDPPVQMSMYQLIAKYATELLSVHSASGEYLFVSPNSYTLFGWQPQELVGRSAYEFFHPEDLSRIAEDHTQHNSPATDVRRVKYRLRCKDDSYRWVLTNSQAHREQGQVQHIICVTHDVHEEELARQRIYDTEQRVAQQERELTDNRRRTSEALRAANLELVQLSVELQRSNQELEQFAYVASHDLKEPLRAVAGCVQALQHRYEDQLDERAKLFIHHAVEGVSRMETLIDDLLMYSHVGTHNKSFSWVAMEQVVQRACTMLTAVIEKSQAEITHDPLPRIWGDEGQLLQLIQNLLSNALKFQGDESPRIHIGVQHTNDGWQFSVTDKGIGIAPEHLERIFKIFQRLHTRREYPGTGIGLALCKKIVEQHGGNIWVESEVAQYTTFHFTIPHPES